ncbi:MAG: cupin domain-containing protein [Deltaproteobacteria bacterium]|nr:cupin domain-containing protein [Deltaproteobacteria bacterium]MBW1961196.1 cupin domain-containing protein [Deltaproteobacteria bacterium]MBW1995065.1 cupin domain-containing protein [Deltaproteobacteria bacterium]MBW2152481.1 cupin domain-containing protein [Deltaproteobacteria bacterium]
MGNLNGKGYLVRRQSEVQPVPCPCGSSVRIIQRQDTPVANLHVTHIQDSRKHYHKHCTEYYYILEGSGYMEVGNDEVELQPGTTIVIDKGTPHRGYGDFKALIVGIPAMVHDDEFFCE